MGKKEYINPVKNNNPERKLVFDVDWTFEKNAKKD